MRDPIILLVVVNVTAALMSLLAGRLERNNLDNGNKGS